MSSAPTPTNSLEEWLQALSSDHSNAWTLMGTNNQRFALDTLSNVTVTPFQIPQIWVNLIQQKISNGTLTPNDVAVLNNLNAISPTLSPSTNPAGVLDLNQFTPFPSPQPPTGHSGLVLQSLTRSFLDEILPCLPELVRSFLFDAAPQESSHVAQISMHRPQSRLHRMLAPRNAAKFAQRVSAILMANLQGPNGPLAAIGNTKISKQLYDAYLLVLLCAASVLQVAPENPECVPLLGYAVETCKTLKLNQEGGIEQVVLENVSRTERDFGYRIFWSLFVSSHQNALIWNTIPAIRPEECNVPIPVSARFGDKYEAITSLPPCYIHPFQPLVSPEVVKIMQVDPYATLVTLYAITGRVMEYRISCMYKQSDEAFRVRTKLENDFKMWSTALPGLAITLIRHHVSIPMASFLVMNNLFMYHAANCLLHAPLNNQITDEWENSTSYLACSQHAFQGTAILAAALRGTAANPMAIYSPYYMVCTWILGLIHILFLRRTLVYVLNDEWEVGLSEDGNDILLVHRANMKRIVEPTMPTPAGLFAGRFDVPATMGGGMQAANQAQAWRTAGAGLRSVNDPRLLFDFLRSSGIIVGPEYDLAFSDDVQLVNQPSPLTFSSDDIDIPPTPPAQGVTNTMLDSGLNPDVERLLSQALGQAQLHLQALQTFGSRVGVAIPAREKLIRVLLGEEHPSQVHVFKTVIQEMGIEGNVISTPGETPAW